MSTADVVVVGGGLAGCAFAIKAAQAGRSVVLLESTRSAHHKVCGEFLSGEALGFLSELGINPERHGAMPIDVVRLAGRATFAECALPFCASSLTRRCLDELLLLRAEQSGAVLLRGATVTQLQQTGAGMWSAHTGNAETLADAAVLATGKRDLRGWRRPPGKQNELVAFKMYWRLSPAQQAANNRAIELLLFRGGYGGLQQVEDGSANFSCLVEAERLKELGGWQGVIEAAQAECALLRERLAEAEALQAKPLAVSSIPYGMVRGMAVAAGLWTLGDQAAVIPSFTGDGMSIALHSGLLAARMYLAGAGAAEFQPVLAQSVKRQINVATVLSRGMLSLTWSTLLLSFARAVPDSMRRVANATRIPQSAWT